MLSDGLNTKTQKSGNGSDHDIYARYAPASACATTYPSRDKVIVYAIKVNTERQGPRFIRTSLKYSRILEGKLLHVDLFTASQICRSP